MPSCSATLTHISRIGIAAKFDSDAALIQPRKMVLVSSKFINITFLKGKPLQPQTFLLLLPGLRIPVVRVSTPTPCPHSKPAFYPILIPRILNRQ